MTRLDPRLLWHSLDGLLQRSEVSSHSRLSLVVGLSGGVDSIVLLHTLVLLQKQYSENPFKLKAIHVNHQLQLEANDWQRFCVSFCEKWQIDLQCTSVDAAPTHGEGPEAAARNARYAALKKHLVDDDVLLTAHHLDDQIETLFLHLLRGTGVDGAAGMRPLSKFHSTYLVRPLLVFSREAIETYAKENHLQWVNDPSNTEVHYDRNYLRHNVLPVIEQRWPSYRQTVGRFSLHMRQLSDLIKEIAGQDYDVVFHAEKNRLDTKKLAELSLPRVNNVLRHWLTVANFSLPSESQLSQIHTAIAAREDSAPIVSWGNVEIRRFKNNLYLMDLDREKPSTDFVKKTSDWSLGQQVIVPGYGVLELRPSKGAGIKSGYLSGHDVEIKFRQGGEKCKPDGRDKTQTLKKIFQEINLPPWLRHTTPIIFIDEEIAAVVGEFYCFPFAARDGQGVEIVRLPE